MPAQTRKCNKGFGWKPKKDANSSNWNQNKRNGGGIATQMIREQRKRNTTVNSGHSRQSGEGSQTENRSNNGYREVTKALRKESERAFFNKFFEDEPKLLDEYNERISESSDGFIKWDFLPRINGEYGPQYSKALSYVRREIAMARIDRPDHLSDLKDLTEEVIRLREEDIAKHINTCDNWKRVIDAINQKQNEMKFLETRIPDVDVDDSERRSSKNFFLRLLCCCCS